MLRLMLALVAALSLAGCLETVTESSSARVLVMGDSMMAYNRAGGGSVADAIEAGLGEEVIDRAVTGAGVLGSSASEGIPGQFISHDWDWVVLNGYGNDLLWGCGCGACARHITDLISADGTSGAIPELVAQLRAGGARVIYTGYLRTPGFASPVESCVALGDEMDRRLGAMARQDAGVFFLSLADLVPDGDQSFHGPDRVHPSPKGSLAIGGRVVGLIRAVENR